MSNVSKLKNLKKIGNRFIADFHSLPKWFKLKIYLSENDTYSSPKFKSKHPVEPLNSIYGNIKIK